MSRMLLNEILSCFPRLALAQLPSPVFAASSDSDSCALDNVYVKHDGVCASHYAGNKVRKLEFLLAEAQRRGARHVVTLGAAGSNHAVATSTYAHQLGMTCAVSMSHQPPSAIATKNLRRHVALGTQLSVFSRFSRTVQYASELATQADTFLVPLGGSDPLASLGYINAARELSDQIDDGLLPLPGAIYVACGTMGTAVGLALGLALLRLPVKVVAVRVTETSVASRSRFDKLYSDSVELIKRHVPHLDLDRSIAPERVAFVDDFFGEAYAQPTPEAEAAIKHAEAAGITLDGTYTGKAFAALMADGPHTPDRPVLFWCTLNAVETPMARHEDLARLGPEFERYW